MRRLFAPLTRWLDQRIDARIAAAERCVPTGHAALAEMAVRGIQDALIKHDAFSVPSPKMEKAKHAGWERSGHDVVEHGVDDVRS